MILGIDPGLNGGIAFMSLTQAELSFISMPRLDKGLDLNSIDDLFNNTTIEMAFLEQVASRPGQSCVATFTFGRGFGALEALLTCHKIPYTLVPPKVWTKVIHAGITGDDPKKKSLVAINRLFPGLDLRRTEKSKVPHDGIVDAILIAEYGRRTMIRDGLQT